MGVAVMVASHPMGFGVTVGQGVLDGSRKVLVTVGDIVGVNASWISSS